MTRQLFAAAVAAVAVAGCNPGSTATTTKTGPAGTVATHTTDSPDGTKSTEVKNDTKPTTADAPATKADGPLANIHMPNIPGMTAKDAFSIHGPSVFTSHTMTQGDRRDFKLSLTRGSEFKDDVKLTTDGPSALKVEFGKSTVAASDPTEVDMTVTVAKDAPAGDHVIKVTGTPGKGGAPVTKEVKVKVNAK